MMTLVWFFVLTILAEPAFGYLDPSSGSMLVSTLVGILATLLFFLKGMYYEKMSGVLGFLRIQPTSSGDRHQLVFYSEGSHYWNTFKPVLDELVRRMVPCRYLTSDENDPGLLYSSELVEAKYIGTGTKAYSYLRFLEADVCAMTTPGLEVLQIKRSKGVKHYTYLVHAPTDAAIYKLYSFDYYDSILTCGDHQIKSIKKLEVQRGTRPKHIINAGCLYYDEMKRHMKNYEVPKDSKPHITVLVAPTWGANGLLRKSGARILKLLLEKGYEVIFRPHPQSSLSEEEILNGLREELRPYPNLQWDQEPDGMRSMAKADVMVSDLSGVAFDFAFVFEKPVITVKSDFNQVGLEAADLPWEPWEFGVLDLLGRQIDEAELDQLPEILTQEVGRKGNKTILRQLREESVSNFSCAAPHVVNELLHIQDGIKNRKVSQHADALLT